MKTLFKTILTCLTIAVLLSCSEDDGMQLAQWEIEVNQLKDAMAKYENIDVATAEGFFDASGFVPNMGHHYLLPQRVDNTFELLSPEIVLYAPDANGNMEFVAVEYVTPVADLDNPGSPPEGFTGNLDQWHLNTNLSQWQLHVWIGKENPDGIFAEFNPDVGTGN
ncbi:MAG: hypothetical protein QNJ57_13525 [Flavobacteriaceae bacterium]|nr:hypothetical protein [Flavobacteriaceae bacterium]